AGNRERPRISVLSRTPLPGGMSMARLAVSVTKGNLLKLKEEHALAAEARTFLEEKRDLLLGELLRLQAQAAKMREEVEMALGGAYARLTGGLLAMGSEAVA